MPEHRTDLPLITGEPRFGLGLWQSTALTLLVEAALCLGAIGMRMRGWEPASPKAKFRLGLMVAIMLGGNVSAYLGPYPPSPVALTLSSLFSLNEIVRAAGVGTGAVQRGRAHPPAPPPTSVLTFARAAPGEDVLIGWSVTASATFSVQRPRP